MNRVNALLKHLAVLRVLRHPAMLRLWLAQVIYLSVQFAASYAMIFLVTTITKSATKVGIVVIALSLPIFLLGAPAGTLVDRMEKRTVLWVSNVVRAFATALFVLVLLWQPDGYGYIYVLAFLFSLVGLFFTPAEGAIIPGFVDETELLPALSLYNLTLNISQAVGLLLLGPLALRFLPSVDLPLFGSVVHLTSIHMLFVLVTILYLIAALLTARLPEERKHQDDALMRPSKSLFHQVRTGELSVGRLQHIWDDLKDGWQLVRRDSVLVDGLWQACFGSLIMLAIATLATTFIVKFLEINLDRSSSAVLPVVFAPAGLGLLLGAILVPAIATRIGSVKTIVLGLLGTALGIGILPIGKVLGIMAQPQHWLVSPWFVIFGVVGSIIAGMSLDLIIVPSQTVIQERSPDSMRGRVQALYQALFNGGSIPVILFISGMADVLGIIAVMYVVSACSVMAAALTVWRTKRRGPDTEPEWLQKLNNARKQQQKELSGTSQQ